VIAQKDIDSIFNADVIARLAKQAKVPADADLAWFARNIREDVKSYFDKQFHPDWTKIPRRRGRPQHKAARNLIQRLALTYLEATEKRPPARVRSGLVPEQPFSKVGARGL
jgi:phage gpG-like protein